MRFQDSGRRFDMMPPSALRTRELICPLGSTTTTGLVDKLWAKAFPVQGSSPVVMGWTPSVLYRHHSARANGSYGMGVSVNGRSPR